MYLRNSVLVFGLYAMMSLSVILVIYSTDSQGGGLFNIAFSQRNITQDSSGVPTIDYEEVAGVYVGPQRNPNNIAKTALEAYDDYNQTQDERHLELFLNNTNWLASNAVSKGNYS